MTEKLLRLLRQISEFIAVNEDYSSVLRKTVGLLAEKLEVDVCSVYEYDKKTDRLVLAATYGLKPESIGKVKMKPDEGLTGLCFRQRKVINLANPQEHPDFKYFKSTGEKEFRSFFATPLSVGGNCVGVLTFQGHEPREFHGDILNMAGSLSTQLANLILNSRILKNLASVQEPKVENKVEKRDLLMGIAVNPGLAEGKALCYTFRDLFKETEHAVHTDEKYELGLLDKALTLTRKNTLELERRALTMISEADASIFNSHLLFLEDNTVIDAIKKEITEQQHTLEFSIVVVFRRFEKMFKRLSDKVFRERLIDFKDVMLRLLESVRFLRYQKSEQGFFHRQSGDWILVAEEILPSDLLRIPVDNVRGIVCEKGGATSHVAVLAKALDLPAMLGVNGLIASVEEYDDLLLDCHAERLYVNPDRKVRKKFRSVMENIPVEQEVQYGAAFTADGEKVFLRANISLICETALVKKYGACGIGLYRTEFLYMIRDYFPSEATQYNVFSKILHDTEDEVTVRVLDIGGDKPLPYLEMAEEVNPALGERGIRLLLARPELFKTHLRAILRAGTAGKLKLLLPMITDIDELKRVCRMIEEVKDELNSQNIRYTKEYKLGIMLEVPAAVFALPKLLDHVDFVSIGSNDLLQYTFAVDRSHRKSSTRACLHPVFLDIVRQVGNVVRSFPGKSVAICGEMAGNWRAVPLLLGAGIFELSMPPKIIPHIRTVVNNFSIDECRELLDKAVGMTSARDVEAFVDDIMQQKNIEPEVHPQDFLDEKE